MRRTTGAHSVGATGAQSLVATGARSVVALAAVAMLLGGCQTTPQESANNDTPTGSSLANAGSSSTDSGSTDSGSNSTDSSSTNESRPSLGSAGIPECDVQDLPATALPVIEDIEVGGPYDHPRNDGVRFGNREGILPDEDGDFYREFTVETPGLDHRGARRIVTGGFEETDPEHWYFTGDHYESFCEFDPALITN